MANAYKTNYFDPMGKSHTGYIIEGKTYKDSQGKERVEQGSVVETADGYYTLTSSGGVKTDFINNQAENTKSEIQSLKNGIKKQHEAAYSAKKAQINEQKKAMENAYRQNAQNEYLKAMESEKNMDQLLKMQGLTGGMSESRRLQNKLAYENSVNNLKAQLNEGLSALDEALLELRSETDYNIAEDMAEYDKLYLSYMTKYQDDLADWLQNESKRNADNFKDMYLSEKEDERFKEEMAFDREELELDKEKLAQDAINDQRAYNLNAAKLQKSKDDTEYERKIQEAELAAENGDFTFMAKLFNWTEEQLKEAVNNFKIRGQ